jgi:hypothetical protein
LKRATVEVFGLGREMITRWKYASVHVEVRPYGLLTSGFHCSAHQRWELSVCFLTILFVPHHIYTIIHLLFIFLLVYTQFPFVHKIRESAITSKICTVDYTHGSMREESVSFSHIVLYTEICGWKPVTLRILHKILEVNAYAELFRPDVRIFNFWNDSSKRILTKFGSEKLH